MYPGGTIAVDGRQVGASHRDHPLLKRGETYVLFADRVELTGAFRSARRGGAYVCDGGVCERLSPAVTQAEREVREFNERELLSTIGAFGKACSGIAARLGPRLVPTTGSKQ